MTGRRQQAERYGRKSEGLAALFLRLKGYRILAKRLKTPVGELDLVVQRGNQIVFVEVKARRGRGALYLALEQLHPYRHRRAAQYWLAKNEQYASHQQQFDVIGLAPWRWPIHIQNAFMAHDSYEG
ncbi:YraN family protein [Maritalea mediterranea]|uniref:UPF0102 protein L1I42_00535 n=1 Tax=Maritalea mediterranea TaxID=2909667 RepID=A0ABS9E3Z9_9HYPH|nr:YraN family protein [Maritalea mediterranea]MCF4096969.1 YraN family protein [Maritalea mediterranea]